jgi:hypothetical protein
MTSCSCLQWCRGAAHVMVHVTFKVCRLRSMMASCLARSISPLPREVQAWLCCMPCETLTKCLWHVARLTPNGQG